MKKICFIFAILSVFTGVAYGAFQTDELRIKDSGGEYAKFTGSFASNKTITVPDETGTMVTTESINTSSELASIVGDETGSGALVFADSPTLGAVTATTLDTGQGANELYDMDQNVLTSSTPSFAGLTLTGDLVVDTSDFVVDVSTDFVGIGDATPDNRLEIDDGTVTVGAATTRNVILGQGSYSGGDASSSIRQFHALPTHTGTSNLSTLSGFYAITDDQHSSGTTTHNLAVVGRGRQTGAGTATLIGGGYFDVSASAGTVTELAAVYAEGGNWLTGSGSATQFTGLKVQKPTESSSGGVTRNIGIDIAAFDNSPTATEDNIGLLIGGSASGSASGALYVASGDSTFRDNIISLNAGVSSASGNDVAFDLNWARTSSNTGTTGELKGIELDVAANDASGTVAGVVGGDFVASNGNANTITTLSGVEAQVKTTNASSVVTSGYGVRVNSISNTGTFTNLYGLHIGDLTTGTQTNTPFSIYASDASTLNYFAGNVGLGDTSPSALLTVGNGDIFQVDSSGNLTTTGAIDAGGASSLEIPNSTTLPATCSVGQIYMDTDATSGQRIYACESANTWALQGDGGGAGGGDNITVNTTATTDANLKDSTTISFALDTGTTPDDVTASIVSGSVTATHLGTDSVSADELNATGVEAELEAVLDLSDLQGAVTDAQVPDTVTASNYLALSGGTMTGQIISDNLGVEFDESDTNPTCAAGNFNIYADLSENKLKMCQNGSASDLGGSGSGGAKIIPLPIQSAKITGAYVTATITGVDVATQGAQIDGGDGNWRLLFDATTDEAAVWQVIIPDNYTSTPVIKIQYSMTSANTNEVEWEGAVMCVTPGDSADVGTASFATASTAVETVPGTVGYVDSLVSITPTDDSCAAGDLMYVYISTDANDPDGNDDATGDRELVGAYVSYT